MVIDRSGKTLYIANRVGNDVSIVDIATGKEKKRLPAGHGASYLAISHDGPLYLLHPCVSGNRTRPYAVPVIYALDRQYPRQLLANEKIDSHRNRPSL